MGRLFTGATLVACFVVASRAAQAGLADGWSSYQGDSYHAGYVSDPVDPAKFQFKWHRELPLQPSTRGTPAVAEDGIIYVSSVGTTGRYGIEALHARDGSTAWRYDAPFGYRSVDDPAVANGKVYVSLGGESASAGTPWPALLGLDARTGQQLFKTDHEGQSPRSGQPTVRNGRVFLHGGLYGGIDGYNAETGQRLWFRNLVQQDRWSAAADDQFAYVYEDRQSASGRLQVFDRTTGVVVKSIVDAGASSSYYSVQTPMLDGKGRAFVLVPGFFTPNRLVAFDLTLGAIAWETPVRGGLELATDGDHVFINDTVSIQTFDADDGSFDGEWTSDSSMNWSFFTTDTHWFVSGDAGTWAVNRETLAVDWSTLVAGRLSMASGMLLVTHGGGVTAYAVVPEPEVAAMVVAVLVAALCQRRTVTGTGSDQEHSLDDAPAELEI